MQPAGRAGAEEAPAGMPAMTRAELLRAWYEPPFRPPGHTRVAPPGVGRRANSPLARRAEAARKDAEYAEWVANAARAVAAEKRQQYQSLRVQLDEARAAEAAAGEQVSSKVTA